MKVRLVKFGDQLIPVDDTSAVWWSELKSGQKVELEVIKTSSRRSTAQSNAMFLWCDWVAKVLNDAGYDQLHFPFKEGMEIPWTGKAVVTHLWKTTMAKMLEKRSTKEQTTVDVMDVHEALAKGLSTQLGIEPPPWPKEDS